MSLKYCLKKLGSISASSLNSTRASSRTVSSSSSSEAVITDTIFGRSGVKALVSFLSAVVNKFTVA